MGLLAWTATEFLIEFLNAAFGVDEAFLTSIGWVGICSYVANDDEMVNPINLFYLLGTHGGFCQKLLPSRYVDKADWVKIGMNIFLHGSLPLLSLKLPLTYFKTWVCFTNYINTPLATHYLTIGMAIFQRLDR
ncbi:MAG: hypothetical protein A2007_03935 [Verrucomicrobia bacterium GWC2_42_7]|nr:MAG: hypothetical protein A2007_03935 [Verrucomicrobia bacterium GWC2_42_7]